jgi:hypothetical protein
VDEGAAVGAFLRPTRRRVVNRRPVPRPPPAITLRAAVDVLLDQPTVRQPSQVIARRPRIDPVLRRELPRRRGTGLPQPLQQGQAHRMGEHAQRCRVERDIFHPSILDAEEFFAKSSSAFSTCPVVHVSA